MRFTIELTLDDLNDILSDWMTENSTRFFKAEHRRSPITPNDIEFKVSEKFSGPKEESLGYFLEGATITVEV